MKTHILLSLISLFCLLSGCAEHSSLQDTLDKAENFMENHPDSAYSLLQTIDSDALRTRGGRARYALLYTQALDKNYIDETNDSLISVATNYYQHHGDVRNRFLSLYYKGRVSYNAGDYLHAMLNYSEAETLVPDLQDDYYAGLLYSQLGDIYSKYNDYPKSLEAYQKSCLYYKQVDKDIHHAYTLWNQANVCWQMNEYDDCMRLYNSVLVEADKLQDDVLKRIALGELFMVYMERDSIEMAHTLFDKLDDNYKYREGSAKFRSSIAEYHALMGDSENAECCMKQAWIKAFNVQDSVSLYFAESRLYELIGNHQKAYHSLGKGIQMQTSRIHNVLQQPVLSIQLDYLSQELAFSQYRRKVEKTIWLFSVLVLLVLSMIVIIRFHKRIRQKNESIGYYLKELAGMKLAMEQESSEKCQQMQELFREHFKVVDMLGESFSLTKDEKRHQREVYKQVKLLLDKYDKDNKSYIQLEKFVDRYNGNIMQLLRKEIEFPENTYRQLCYHIAGFSVNVVSLFMKESSSTLYKRRARALEKILKSDSLYKEKLYKYLSK